MSATKSKDVAHTPTLRRRSAQRALRVTLILTPALAALAACQPTM